MCDRDLVTLFPQVVDGARTWSDPPRRQPPTTWCVEEQDGTLRRGHGRGARPRRDAGGRDRRRRVRGRARAVGRRQQRRRPRTRRRGRLRAQRRARTRRCARPGSRSSRSKASSSVGAAAAGHCMTCPHRARPPYRPSLAGDTRCPYNLRNRSFLKEIDFEPRRAAVPARAVRGAEDREVRGHRGPTPRRQGDRADLREDLDPDASRVRGRGATTRARTSPTSIRPARSSVTRSRSPTPPGCSGGCTTPSSSAATRRTTSRNWPSYAGVPVYNGLTDEWHPTQMLADFLTMHEASGKPVRRARRTRSWATAGSTWVDRCWSWARSWAPTSGSPARPSCSRRPTSSTIADDIAATHRRPDHHHRRSRRRRSPASTSSTPTCGCRWARRRTCGTSGSICSRPYQVNRGAARRDREPRRPSSCTACPAFHDTNTVVGRRDHGADRHARRSRGDQRGVRGGQAQTVIVYVVWGSHALRISTLANLDPTC